MNDTELEILAHRIVGSWALDNRVLMPQGADRLLEDRIAAAARAAVAAERWGGTVVEVPHIADEGHMTPEHEAHAIAFGDDLFDELPIPNDDGSGSFLAVNFERLEQRILAAIRAAVAAEHERCIHAVENCTVSNNAPTWEVKRAVINALCDLD